jgi:GT2 family glycosyltransferase
MKLDYPNYEIIVVVDGSTDNTCEVLKKYSNPIKIVEHEENKGLSVARNTGINASDGDIIAFIDDDEVVRSDWLRRLVEAYKTNHRICGAGGLVYKLNSDKLQHGKMKANKFGKTHGYGRGLTRNEFLILQGGNLSFRKEILDEVGGFDPYFTYANDELDLCIRITQKGYKLVYVPNAKVWHAMAEGPHRHDYYNFSKNRVFFCIKNFGTWKTILQLMFYDTAYLIGNIGYYFLSFLLRRNSLKELFKIYKDMIKGRIDGYKDGFRVKKDKNLKGRAQND